MKDPKTMTSADALGALRPGQPKFDAFVKALEALCRMHRVQLSPSMYDALQVWDLKGDESPLNFPDIEDRTETTASPSSAA